MKPLSIEHLMDNEVQTLSGGTCGWSTYPLLDAAAVGNPLVLMPPLPPLLLPRAADAACIAACCWCACSNTSSCCCRLLLPLLLPTGELQRVAICLCLGQPGEMREENAHLRHTCVLLQCC